jgi:hypothetical protein
MSSVARLRAKLVLMRNHVEMVVSSTKDIAARMPEL